MCIECAQKCKMEKRAIRFYLLSIFCLENYSGKPRIQLPVRFLCALGSGKDPIFAFFFFENFHSPNTLPFPWLNLCLQFFCFDNSDSSRTLPVCSCVCNFCLCWEFLFPKISSPSIDVCYFFVCVENFYSPNILPLLWYCNFLFVLRIFIPQIPSPSLDLI